MSKKLLTAWIIASMVLALFSTALTAGPVGQSGKDVTQISMFQAKKFDAHYRVPRDVDAERILEEEGVLLPGASVAQKKAATQAFMTEFIKRNPDTPAPGKLREMLKDEKKGKKHGPDSPIKSLIVPVEFPNTSTFDWCGESVTQVGPLHNEVPAPGPRDNNSIWYEDTNPELYTELYFGQGPDAGVIVHHPNLGDVDLRGNTMANYYLEQSEGKFVPAGLVYPKWLQASQAEGYYGQDSCDGANHNTKAHELVTEVLDEVMADSPDMDWQSFDHDGDGIVDNFTVIHAGAGQEGGGGMQGDFSIWSHASLINWPSGYQVCTAGSVGCPDRDIFVREYSMDPEMIDIGVIAEEFGHAAFGLPDIYTTDYDASVADWAIMEAGSWNGPLAGMQPAPFPLWFRYLVGWAQPAEIDYTQAGSFRVGQLSLRPQHTEQGLKINMPPKTVNRINPLDTGNAWWSDVGDRLLNSITHEFDLAGTTAPIFSFNSYWSIEEDWDAGYVKVSTDGGATWTALPDMEGHFTQSVLNGNNVAGDWNLSGEGTGKLSFDLSAYTGQKVQIQLLYATDTAAQWDGWWGDDFALTDGATTLFSDDVESGAGAWVVNGWKVVPFSDEFPRYYLIEWRNNSGFDQGLKYAYSTVYSDEDEWTVDRVPYTVPGMLVYFRDASYNTDYTLGDSWYDDPSWGPKHALALVDSHFWPMTWNAKYTTGAGVRISRRVQPSNAAFTLQDTTPFTIRRGDGLGGVLETKSFPAQPGISQFHDSMGYYPGFYYNGDGSLYWWDIAASTVVPAQANYSTRITNLAQQPLFGLYGADIGGTVLGSGNPGDDGVQFGLHLAVTDKAKDGSWGQIKVWNSPKLVDVTKTVNKTEAAAGSVVKYTIKIKNLSPVNQKITVTDPIASEFTFRSPRSLYDEATGAVVWSGWLRPNATRVITYIVKINNGVPSGTEITNDVVVTDDALGGTASATLTVK